MTTSTFVIILLLAGIGYHLGRRRAVGGVGGKVERLHSLPGYYGSFVALWCGLPAVLVLGTWILFEPKVLEAVVLDGLGDRIATMDASRVNLLMNDIRNIADQSTFSRNAEVWIQDAAARYAGLKHAAQMAMVALVSAVGVAGASIAFSRITTTFRARVRVEKILRALLIGCSAVAILTTIGIVLSLVFEAFRFFEKIPVLDFLFGLEWSPQTALRADQVGSSGLFGMLPLMAGTLLISFIAMCIAAPIGLLSAIYMAEYAHPGFRAAVKPMLEILAGVPTVVYGFFAALTMAPLLRDSGEALGLSVSSESALAAGVVMGIMIIPFVSSLSDDVISAVPQSMREGSYGLGATKSETIRKVIVPAALPGIVGGLMLAISRAIGETMIVVMAAGLAANLTANPFEAVTTVTVQIVTLLVGDQEFDSAKTLAAFALGLVLFCVTLVLNVVALTVVNRYREQYE